MKKRKTYEVSVINKTYSKTYSDQTKFYTSDTALELNFQLKEVEYDFDSAEIILLNIDDRSLVTRPVRKSADGFTYELEDDIVEHYGEWKGQLKFNKGGEIYVSSPVVFRIENDLGNDRPPQLTDIRDWETLRQSAKDLIAEMGDVVANEAERIEAEKQREETVKNIEARQNSVETQFNSVQQELTNKDPISAPEIIAARGGEPTLSARLDKEQQEVTEQLSQKASQAEMYSNITTPKAMSLSQSPKKKPFISFVDDDGYEKAYSLLAPMLEQRGMVGNLAITVSLVGESNRVTTADLLDLQDRGFEIASHNYTDVYFESANLTPEQIENEMRMTKETLNNWGIRVDNHVYTGGQKAGNVGRSIVKKYFKAGYEAGEGTHTTQNNLILDEMSIKRISLDAPSLAHLKAQVDRCVAENNWLIFMCHCNTWNSERIQIVNDLLDYVATKNVTVGTLSEGYDIFGNSFAVGHDNYIKLLNNGEIYSNVIGSVFNDSTLKNITLDTELNEFDENKITYTNVSAIRSVELGLPETDDGLLVTTRSNSVFSSRQQWQPQVSGNVYERRWNGTILQGSWTPFKGVGFHTVRNLPSTHNQEDLQGQLIVSRIDSAGNAGYPSTGLNITFNNQVGFTKQIFSGANNNRLFLRTFKTDGSKTDWTEYAPAPLKKSVVIPSTAYSENETKVIDIDLLDLMDLSGYTVAQRNRIPLIATCRSASVDNYSYNIRLTNEGIAKLRVTNLGAAKTFPASDWDVIVFRA